MPNPSIGNPKLLSLADIHPNDVDLTPDVRGRRRLHRRNALLMQAFCYGLDATFLSLFALSGTTSSTTPLAFLIAGLSCTLVFLTLSETGFNDRFQEHYLATPQSLVSLSIMFAGAWFAPEVGFVFCLASFIIFAFATLRASAAQAGLLWTVAAIGYSIIILFTDVHLSIPTTHWIDRVASLLIMISIIGRFMFANLFTAAMRDAFYQRSRQLRVAYDRIEQLAQYDELTGVLNRHFIMSALDEELIRARRSAQHYSVALVDLDWFKRINDLYGHPAGDEVLRSFAITIFANIREIDRIGRYGGEEFLLVLPETSPEGAVVILNRLRQLVADLDWSSISPNIKVTMSGGVTSIRKDDSIDSVLSRADQALYRAKELGRNQICAS